MWAPAEEEATAWWKSRRLINKSGGGRGCLWPVFNYKDVCVLCLMVYGVASCSGKEWAAMAVPNCSCYVRGLRPGGVLGREWRRMEMWAAGCVNAVSGNCGCEWSGWQGRLGKGAGVLGCLCGGGEWGREGEWGRGRTSAQSNWCLCVMATNKSRLSNLEKDPNRMRPFRFRPSFPWIQGRPSFLPRHHLQPTLPHPPYLAVQVLRSTHTPAAMLSPYHLQPLIPHFRPEPDLLQFDTQHSPASHSPSPSQSPARNSNNNNEHREIRCVEGYGYNLYVGASDGTVEWWVCEGSAYPQVGHRLQSCSMN